MDPALAALGEFGLIRLIRRRIRQRSPGTILGIGDDAAVVAARQHDTDDEHGQDADFFRGKVVAAKYYVNYVLPGVQMKLGAILGGDRSALDMPDGGFAPAR